MNSDDNPYRPSAHAGNKIPDTGFNVLVGGLFIALICLFIVTYLMLGLVPDVKDQREERALGMPSDLRAAVDIADFLVRYWYVWLVAIPAALVLIAQSLGNKNRRLAYRTFGFLLAVFSLSYTAWLLVSSVAATP